MASPAPSGRAAVWEHAAAPSSRDKGVAPRPTPGTIAGFLFLTCLGGWHIPGEACAVPPNPSPLVEMQDEGWSRLVRDTLGSPFPASSRDPPHPESSFGSGLLRSHPSRPCPWETGSLRLRRPLAPFPPEPASPAPAVSRVRPVLRVLSALLGVRTGLQGGVTGAATPRVSSSRRETAGQTLFVGCTFPGGESCDPFRVFSFTKFIRSKRMYFFPLTLLSLL